MQRRNPFPGVSCVVDRHGKRRWRGRKKGLPSIYLPGAYGSVEFRAAYEAWIAGGERVVSPSRQHEHGSIDWLIEQYQRTTQWQALAPISRRVLIGEMERFRAKHGRKLMRTLTPEAVDQLIARRIETPAAANRLLKLIRRLARYAIKRGLISHDPSISVKPLKENPEGFHTWTDDEILQFEAKHGVGSKAVLALRLALYTGAARQDVIRLGWQSVRNGRISYRRGKTGGEVDLPILEGLSSVISSLPSDRLLFLEHSGGRPYKPETFGNWFRDRCVEAGLPNCSLHGLRKAGATRLANAGCSEHEIMAYLGHKTPSQAQLYTKAANRSQLADSAMRKLQGVSNRVTRLDRRGAKKLTGKDN